MPTHKRQDGLSMCKKQNIIIMAFCELNPGKKPSCKALLDEWKSYSWAGILIWEQEGRETGNAAHPPVPHSPTRRKNLRAIFQLTKKRRPVFPFSFFLFKQKPPASRPFLPLAFLPRELLAGAELIWARWEFLSSFRKET